MDRSEAFLLLFSLALIAFVVIVAVVCVLLARIVIHRSLKPPARFKDFKSPHLPVTTEYLAATGILKKRYVVGLFVVVSVYVLIFLLIAYEVLPGPLLGG